MTLEEENQCLREIVAHVNEGIILTDQACQITIFNPAKEKMERMSAQEVLGKVSWDAYSHSSWELSEHRQVFDSGVPILNAYTLTPMSVKHPFIFITARIQWYGRAR